MDDRAGEKFAGAPHKPFDSSGSSAEPPDEPVMLIRPLDVMSEVEVGCLPTRACVRKKCRVSELLGIVPKQETRAAVRGEIDTLPTELGPRHETGTEIRLPRRNQVCSG